MSDMWGAPQEVHREGRRKEEAAELEADYQLLRKELKASLARCEDWRRRYAEKFRDVQRLSSRVAELEEKREMVHEGAQGEFLQKEAERLRLELVKSEAARFLLFRRQTESQSTPDKGRLDAEEESSRWKRRVEDLEAQLALQAWQHGEGEDAQEGQMPGSKEPPGGLFNPLEMSGRPHPPFVSPPGGGLYAPEGDARLASEEGEPEPDSIPFPYPEGEANGEGGELAAVPRPTRRPPPAVPPTTPFDANVPIGPTTAKAAEEEAEDPWQLADLVEWGEQSLSAAAEVQQLQAALKETQEERDAAREEVQKQAALIEELTGTVADLKAARAADLARAADEADDLTQEMAELRFELTERVEREQQMRAEVEGAALRRVQELEAQLEAAQHEAAKAAVALKEAGEKRTAGREAAVALKERQLKALHEDLRKRAAGLKESALKLEARTAAALLRSKEAEARAAAAEEKVRSLEAEAKSQHRGSIDRV
eukprot:TRINITY_DN3685_c0_g2_i1.p1 TRINITY_DN3685_c0_g2~~TRINITY_DN3685_c0_g2_i1.p1  ORF type:complete len:484 (+),score=179.79 TRINITY_DN3685_c0_g2_i1:244-1695(+)